MPRLPRHHKSDSYYHVMLRGNAGENIFFTESDRHAMCFLLQDGITKYDHRIHAFCLMNNHIHLLIQVGEVPLSKIIQNLAFRYSQRFNEENQRKGHLFQGRFKSILIDENKYFLRLLRYIHMNPVRANIVIAPENYKWSSHRAYLNQCTISWLTTDYGFSKFSAETSAAIALYNSFVLESTDEEELKEIRNLFLGEDTLEKGKVNKSQADLTSNILLLEKISHAVYVSLDISSIIVLSDSKQQQACLAREIIVFLAYHENISFKEISLFLKRDESTVTRSLTKFNLKSKDKMLVELIQKVKSMVV